MIPVIALTTLQYHGRTYTRGDRFEVTPLDAAALHYKGLATHDIQRKVIDPDPPSGGEDSTSLEKPKRRRAYRRRDLTPEP